MSRRGTRSVISCKLVARAGLQLTIGPAGTSPATNHAPSELSGPGSQGGMSL